MPQLIHRAKSTFASKNQQQNFRSAFTPPKYYSFSTNQLHSLKLKAADILKSIFVKEAHSLATGEFKVNKDLWGGDKIPIHCLPVGFHSKCPPKVGKPCDLPGCLLSNSSLSWSQFDSCHHSFHDECLVDNSFCPICQSFFNAEIRRLVRTAKESVESPKLEKFNLENASEETDEICQDPCIQETSEHDLQSKIKEIENELANLASPTLISDENMTCDSFSAQDKPVYRCPHCNACGHEKKGHRKLADDKTTCSMCIEGICSTGGKQIKCTCDFHSGPSSLPKDDSEALPLIENSHITVFDGNYRCILPQQVSQDQLATLPWSNACTVISLYAGIAFLNGELEIPSLDNMEMAATKYMECMKIGISTYENVLEPPDNQPNMSVNDVLRQIRLPIQDPGMFNKGIMLDETYETSFESTIAETSAKPGLKCLLFILEPDHSIIYCLNEHSLAVFDSHGFGYGRGAMILHGPLQSPERQNAFGRSDNVRRKFWISTKVTGNSLSVNYIFSSSRESFEEKAPKGPQQQKLLVVLL